MTVGVVEVGVVDTVLTSQEETLSGTGARVYTAHRGWLGVVMGISAASTGGRSSQLLRAQYGQELSSC